MLESKKTVFVINKVPLAGGQKDIAPGFPSLSTLHLGLLENTRKLRKDAAIKLIDRVKYKKEESSESLVDDANESGGEVSDVEEQYSEIPESSEYDSDTEYSTSDEESSSYDIVKKIGREKKSKPQKQKQESSDEQQESQESSSIAPEVKEEKEKEELLRKFDLMKRSCPDKSIPDFSEHSDINMMRKTYKKLEYQISMDSNIQTYKTILAVGFIVIEFIGIHYFRMDMAGFANAQQLHNYDKLLVELGERSYSNLGSRLPVELRLIGLLLFNAAIFYIGKKMSNSSGNNILTTMLGIKFPNSGPRQPSMNRPSISRDRIEAMRRNAAA